MTTEVKYLLVGAISPTICGIFFILGYWIGGGMGEDVYASVTLLTLISATWGGLIGSIYGSPNDGPING